MADRASEMKNSEAASVLECLAADLREGRAVLITMDQAGSKWRQDLWVKVHYDDGGRHEG